eukprot:COSAG04_NODE_964_length_9140_cov_15.786196_2_plen_233_part_00
MVRRSAVRQAGVDSDAATHPRSSGVRAGAQLQPHASSSPGSPSRSSSQRLWAARQAQSKQKRKESMPRMAWAFASARSASSSSPSQLGRAQTAAGCGSAHSAGLAEHGSAQGEHCRQKKRAEACGRGGYHNARSDRRSMQRSRRRSFRRSSCRVRRRRHRSTNLQLTAPIIMHALIRNQVGFFGYRSFGSGCRSTRRFRRCRSRESSARGRRTKFRNTRLQRKKVSGLVCRA